MKPLFILGLGASGLSILRYCQRLNLAAEIFDTRLNPPGLSEFKQQYVDFNLHLGPLLPEALLAASQIIVSPGLDSHSPLLDQARTAGIPIIGDIELFVQQAKAPIIGITGTNAKGTVTTLIALMLQAAGYKVLVGGNIGTPALDLLLEPVPDYYVLELSSFQLETTVSLQAHVAVLLNISIDHLDRHGSMNAYLSAKHVIYHQAKQCILNRDEPLTWPTAITPTQCFSFGYDEPVNERECGLRTIDGECYLACGAHNILAVKRLPIKGRHNALNALAALALGFSLQLAIPAMIDALSTFPGLAHRCQFVRECDQVTWYNDSKGTNVGATLAALNGLGTQKNLILIAGGVSKGQDFTPLVAVVERTCKIVIVLGEAADYLQQLLKGCAIIFVVTSLAEAVAVARRMGEAGNCVLLSPACASLDMFKNFEARGTQFVELVINIPPAIGVH